MTGLPTVESDAPLPSAVPLPRRSPLVPECSDFLDGDVPAAGKVAAFLGDALDAASGRTAAAALVPWICDVLQSNHSVKAYGRDLTDFVRHMQAQGIGPLDVTADGAAFVFASSGTNPTLLLLVELSKPEGEEAKWQYSLARMTVRAMTVELDGQLVYEQAFAGFGGVVQPSWLAFPQKGLLPDETEK